MARGIDIAVSRVSAAPMPVRAVAAARGSLAANAGDGQAAVAEVPSRPAIDFGREPEFFRYNSFEFRYRQDVGKIVLIGQSPETGERVVQVPSEEALRAYAQRERAKKAENAIRAHGVDVVVPRGDIEAAPQPSGGAAQTTSHIEPQAPEPFNIAV